jgi:hypothetical protein
MFFPSENELFFGAGINEKEIQLTNLDFYKILPKITKKPFKVMKYFELCSRPEVVEIPNKELVDYNIILYHYPGFIGHWTLLCMDKDLEKAYFFDPYGRDVDTQWPFPLKEMPTDNCQHDYTIQIKSITMKCLLHISILSLISYHIIKSCIDLNTYEKNQKY